MHLEIYPESPDDLPQALLLQAYVKGEQPCKEGSDLGLATKQFSCRKTNTLVRGSSSTALATSNTDGQGILAQQMKMMQQMFTMWQQGHGQADADLSGLEVFPQRRRRVKALPPVEPEHSVPKAREPAVEAQPSGPKEGESADQCEVKTEVDSALFDLPALTSLNNDSLTPTAQQEVVGDAFLVKKRKKAAVETEEVEKSTEGAQKTKTKEPVRKQPKAKAQPQPKKQTAKKGSANNKPALPAPPAPGEGTVHYRGGKIHRSDRSCSWRVFIKAQDRCDRKVPWHGNEKTSWSRALAMIDEAQQ